MAEEFVNGQWRDPSVLPPTLRRLHRRQMDAIAVERETRDSGWDAAEQIAVEEELRQASGV